MSGRGKSGCIVQCWNIISIGVFVVATSGHGLGGKVFVPVCSLLVEPNAARRSGAPKQVMPSESSMRHKELGKLGIGLRERALVGT
jgi:hypothetical protein